MPDFSEIRAVFDAEPVLKWVVLAAFGAAALVHRKPKTRALLPFSALLRVVGGYVAWASALEIGHMELGVEMTSAAAPWAALLVVVVALTMILTPRKEIVVIDNPPPE